MLWYNIHHIKTPPNMCIYSTSIILPPPAEPRIPITGTPAFFGGSEGEAGSELTDDRRHGIEGETETHTVTELVQCPKPNS